MRARRIALIDMHAQRHAPLRIDGPDRAREAGGLQVLEQQADHRVDDILLNLGERPLRRAALAAAAEDADVLYTDVWVSMGKEEETKERIQTMSPYQVTADLFATAQSLLFRCRFTFTHGLIPLWKTCQT